MRAVTRILVAEDSRVLREVAAIQLEALGYEADFAENGVAALEVWGRHEHAIILMDCHMPEMDGYDVTREIRRRERADEHTIIVALTANESSSEREKCLAAGMDDFLSKPVSQDALAENLGKWERHIALRS